MATIQGEIQTKGSDEALKQLRKDFHTQMDYNQQQVGKNLSECATRNQFSATIDRLDNLVLKNDSYEANFANKKEVHNQLKKLEAAIEKS
jgi:hypothetical protein